jgi:hypothetical protein
MNLGSYSKRKKFLKNPKIFLSLLTICIKTDMTRKGIEYQLRRAIDNSALSHNQLSAKSGVDSTRLRLFIKGRKSLTLTAAENLADALGLKFKMIRQAPWW